MLNELKVVLRKKGKGHSVFSVFQLSVILNKHQASLKASRFILLSSSDEIRVKSPQRQHMSKQRTSQYILGNDLGQSGTRRPKWDTIFILAALLCRQSQVSISTWVLLLEVWEYLSVFLISVPPHVTLIEYGIRGLHVFLIRPVWALWHSHNLVFCPLRLCDSQWAVKLLWSWSSVLLKLTEAE